MLAQFENFSGRAKIYLNIPNIFDIHYILYYHYIFDLPLDFNFPK